HRVKTTLRSIRCTEPHVRNPLRTTPPSTGGPGGCWCRADHVAPGAAARHRLPGDRLLVAGAAVVVAECRRGGVGLRRVRARCPVPGGRPGGPPPRAAVSGARCSSRGGRGGRLSGQ